MVVNGQDIKNYFYYCPLSGVVRRSRDIIRANGRPMRFPLHEPVGAKTCNGYLTVSWFGKQYLLHRLAWYLHAGYWPPHQIDHINGDRSDNRWSNLREVTNQQNQMNRTTKSGKDTDLPVGVYRAVRKGRPGVWYVASLQTGSIRKNTYKRSEEDAIKVRKTWEEEYFSYGEEV